ncbi:4218_t:CDS:2 [Paraglomus occultum]|uniref:4218_t:CDS:1 n=1 Tax=Paraglomus occultum TaxID=144539 RepID=A0A9N9G629_9GLOM|nr:4218_t:CDS:2 [Paraglomus occultum]
MQSSCIHNILRSKAELISNSNFLIKYIYTFRGTPIQFHSRTKSIIPSCARPTGSQIFRRRLTTNNGSRTNNQSTTDSKDKPILTELIYGRTRIFTALAPASTPRQPVQRPRPKLLRLHYSDNGNRKSLILAFQNYPETVHECYAKFHIWLAAETFIGSSTGVLCSQAMLSSLGLGQAEAAAGAVAIQWVLKDGFGEIGKLFFIKRFAYSFDSHPKTWRMLSGNIGDIVAKDDAQMSFAHLLGYEYSNLYATLSLLNAAQFEILNQAKLSLIAKQYIDTGEVPTMDELKDREIGFGEWIKPGKSPISVKLRLGVPASEAFRRSEDIQRSLSVLTNENYLFNYHQKRNVIDILYHSDAESNDIIKSVLHALKFYDSLAAKVLASKEKIDDERFVKLVHESHGWTNENFGKFVADLDDKDWQSDVVFWKDR